MRSALGGRPVILAASTHGGEEALILERFAALAQDAISKPLLIIAPRHVGRGAEIERLVLEAGLAAARRSAGAGPAGVDVYVADTVGDLGLWYRLAGLAVLGGSLVPGVGGHNPLEPARLGCPFVAGPHVENWPLYADLVACRASAIVPSPAGLNRYFHDVLDDPAALGAMARRARGYVAMRDAEAGEAIARVLALIGP
jgi:3-deoxy-D-manno-octulosonic-acid transferase